MNTARDQLLSDLSLETQVVQRKVKAALDAIEAEIRADEAKTCNRHTVEGIADALDAVRGRVAIVEPRTIGVATSVGFYRLREYVLMLLREEARPTTSTERMQEAAE